MEPHSTIMIPTTGDRAALVEQALWSIQRQTITNWEVFILGDGVSDSAREQYLQWAAGDSRIRFFDHPKHPRRGEEYRHDALLNHARSQYVCYLCDRDLYLPHHLEMMGAALKEVDFAHTLPVSVHKLDRITSSFEAAISLPEERYKMANPISFGHGLPLPVVGHRLDFYKTLELGWSTTPKEKFTDIYMWSKFLNHPNCRFRTCLVPTVIHLPRGSHPGWPPEERLVEMLRWRDKMEQPGFYEAYLESVIEVLVTQKITRSSSTLITEIQKRLGLEIKYSRQKGGVSNISKATVLGFVTRALRLLEKKEVGSEVEKKQEVHS